MTIRPLIKPGETRFPVEPHNELGGGGAIDAALLQVRMRVIHPSQCEMQWRIAAFVFPNQFRLPRTPRFGARRHAGHRDAKPLLQSARRLPYGALLHGGNQIQNIALGLAGEAVKHILAEAGPKGIVTLSPMDRTAALQLILVPTQARHLIMAQHLPPG